MLIPKFNLVRSLFSSVQSGCHIKLWFKCHNKVLLVQYPIRLFDDLNLNFIKPFEVTTERDRSLNNRFDKTDFKPNEFLLETPLLWWRLFQSFVVYPSKKIRPDQIQEIFQNLRSDKDCRSKIKNRFWSKYVRRARIGSFLIEITRKRWVLMKRTAVYF